MKTVFYFPGFNTEIRTFGGEDDYAEKVTKYGRKLDREPPEPEPSAGDIRELFLVSEVTSTPENQDPGVDPVAGRALT